MTWLVLLIRRIWSWIFPARASTQTWMLLTFMLFVGMAVAAVAAYTLFILRDDVQAATEQTLSAQASRLGHLIDQADTPQAQVGMARTIARVTSFRITVVQDGRVVVDLDGSTVASDGNLLNRPEMVAALGPQQSGFDRREGARGRLLYYAAWRMPSGLIVRIGSPESPLFELIRRMQVVLVVGMVLALALSVLGSWIAAQKVTGPLETIRDSARRISEGQLDKKIQVRSRAAEFQDLERSINRMAESFRQKIDEMQGLAKLQNEFIGNVSHEVRNPIFAVGGYLEALASPKLSNDQRQLYSDKGLANLERLNNLFADLIEIARLEYREDLLRPSVFDLQALLEEVDEMLRPKAVEKGLDLYLHNEPLKVQADRNRIRQVLVNLVENAIAYSDEGSVRCRYRRHLDKVRIEVVDTGKGIPEEHQARIFERFYRVDPDRSRKSGGTGLGLSIVKQILHAHGHQIHLESTPERGSRFWFELPLAAEAVTEG